MPRVLASAAGLALFAAACGSSGIRPAPTFTLSGTLVGLGPARTVTLANNGADPLVVSLNGSFTFAQAVPAEAAYAVSVLEQPAGEVCAVVHDTGIAVAAVTDVLVTCQEAFAIGGELTGLGPGNRLVLALNGAEDTTVNSDGPFAFQQLIVRGASYAVTVKTQPVGQVCEVVRGSGSAQGAVTDVAVTCR
jgi:hypothetical protein